MASFSSGGNEFIHGCVHEESEGPYGFIILGLAYHWNEDDKALKINSVMLVRVDLILRCSVEPPLYEDMFSYPYKGIYEKDGQYFYDGCPVINYKMLNIPETLTGVVVERESFFHHSYKRFLNSHGGGLKYSVNPICVLYSTNFKTMYTELY